MPGKRPGGNKHLKSIAGFPLSLLAPGPDRNCIHSIPLPGETNLFSMQNFFFFFLFFVLETSTELTEEVRPKGLHLRPKLVILCEIILKKNKFLNRCLSLGQCLPTAPALWWCFLFVCLFSNVTQIMTCNTPEFTLTSFQVAPKAIFSYILGRSGHQPLSF